MILITLGQCFYILDQLTSENKKLKIILWESEPEFTEEDKIPFNGPYDTPDNSPAPDMSCKYYFLYISNRADLYRNMTLLILYDYFKLYILHFRSKDY